MQPTRRDFLRLGLGASTLLTCGASVPVFLARSANALAAEPGSKAKGNVLVVVQLNGGNDGLNTVVPYNDADYRKHRPKLHVAASAVARIDDRVGFHPALADFGKLLEARQLAVVQSVGYPNPNRSHFESMAIWQAARLGARGDAPGWLARMLDGRMAAPGGDAAALHVGDGLLPQALAGGRQPVPSLVSLEQFRRRIGVPTEAGATEQRAALDEVASRNPGKPGSLAEFVAQSSTLTYASSARLEGVLTGSKGTVAYPEFYGLARQLRLVAQLIKAGLATSIYYTEVGGFDTHANQLNTHPALLREVGASLHDFVEDVNQSGDGGRVLVLVFSEFGRRLAENASAGTDHGTAAPVLLLGAAVKAGLHGPYPNLQDLEDGDPKHAIDFRQVYATLLDKWLGCPAETVLGAKFASLPIL
jgi:uncharacterized protein (DUF1501 family)